MVEHNDRKGLPQLSLPAVLGSKRRWSQINLSVLFCLLSIAK
jgi:hypothetical protein